MVETLSAFHINQHSNHLLGYNIILITIYYYSCQLHFYNFFCFLTTLLSRIFFLYELLFVAWYINYTLLSSRSLKTHWQKPLYLKTDLKITSPHFPVLSFFANGLKRASYFDPSPQFYGIFNSFPEFLQTWNLSL